MLRLTFAARRLSRSLHSTCRDLDCINAGLNPWSAWSAEETTAAALTLLRHGWWIESQIPNNTIESCLLRPFQIAHYRTTLIRNRHLNLIFGLVLHVVIDNRTIRGIGRGEPLVAGVAFTSVKPKMCSRGDVEEMDILRQNIFRGALERAKVVEHPNRSSMRGQHQRIVTRVDLNIVDANQRQVS